MYSMPVLRGYKFSVYNRIARTTLLEKGVSFEVEEVDPFRNPIPRKYLSRHPFGLVPVFSDGAFDVYETSAICRYIDAAYDGPALLPLDAKVIARVAQVVSIVDSYAYKPMVRQVFAHRVFRPAEGGLGDETEIKDGLAHSEKVLEALNAIATESLVLNCNQMTLADCHLAPIIGYFTQAEEGRRAIETHTAIAEWWLWASQRQSVLASDPSLPVRPKNM